MAEPVKDEWILRNLGIRAASAEDTQGQASLVKLQKSRLAWDGLRKSVQAQLQSIEKAVLDGVKQHNDDPEQEEGYDADEVATKVRSIYTVLDVLDTRLIDKLDEALNAEGAERARLNTEARGLVGEYAAAVQSMPMLSQIDGNGFAATSIQSATQKTLAALSAQL